MRYLFGFMCVLALGLMGCSAPSGTGGSGGDGGMGGTGGVTMVVCPPGAVAPAPETGTTPLACRNSFDGAVSEFSASLDVELDCAIAGEPFNASVTPSLTLDPAFLQDFANYLCFTEGEVFTSVTVNHAQVRIDAVQGATCESQLSELSPVPQEVDLDVTIDGICGQGGSVTVNSVPSLSLSEVSLPCMADDAAGEPVVFCATGITPLEVPFGTTVDTSVSLSFPPFELYGACGGPATIEPPPGDENDVGCSLWNPAASTPDGLSCEADVGTATFGETPFPASDCNMTDGPPNPNQMCQIAPDVFVPCTGTCTTVPVAVDPTTACVTFTLVELGTGGAGGAGGGAGGAGG